MTTANSQVIVDFLATFAQKDASKLGPFFHQDVVFQNYGEGEVRGRDNLVAVWEGVFRNFEQVEFTTLHSAVNGDLVIEEQVHGFGLPGRKLAPVKNMAIYRLQDGQIIEWRDYTNSEYARTLLH
jgi:limonene-1,2-epoxide hydrolase